MAGGTGVSTMLPVDKVQLLSLQAGFDEAVADIQGRGCDGRSIAVLVQRIQVGFTVGVCSGSGSPGVQV